MKAIREQSDSSDTPGEQSISREDLWRSVQSSWHKGAGQRYLDKPESDKERFWASRGVDVWTQGQLTLLPDVSKRTIALSSTQLLCQAGNYTYLADGTTVFRSLDLEDPEDLNNWEEVALPSPSTVTSIATNGYTVWVCTEGGTYYTNTGTTSWTSWLTAPASGDYELVAFVNNRLVVTNERYICEVTGTSTVTVLNPNEYNSNWRWTAITDGMSAIYAAGYSGKTSQIFSISPPTDDPSAALGVPLPAAPPMPTGEIVRALESHLGFIGIGTDKGFRVAEKLTDYSNRDVIGIGRLTETPNPVLCIDGVGQFLYFGWTNYDSSYTGLGRINLAQMTDVGLYAYASDIMATVNGAVTSICYTGSRVAFAVTGWGVFAESADPCGGGYVDSGYIRYGVADDKVAQSIEVRYKTNKGSITASINTDDKGIQEISTADLTTSVLRSASFKTGQPAGTSHEVRISLGKVFDGETFDEGPTVDHIELRSAVVPQRGETFLIPVLLYEADADYEVRHPLDDFDALRTMARYRHSVTYQEKSKVFNIIITDYQFIRHSRTTDERWWNGTMVLRVMVPAGS